MTVIYIYLIATMACIARPTVTTAEEFKKSPSLFYPDWNTQHHYFQIQFWTEKLVS